MLLRPGLTLLLASSSPIAHHPRVTSVEDPAARAQRMEDSCAQLAALQPGEMTTTARQLLATELRREGMQAIDSPFSVAVLPGAARAFGWASECAYGARLSVAQLGLLSGWPGSAACLGTALLLVLPLLQLRSLAFVLHAIIGPPATACRFACVLADEAVLFLSPFPDYLLQLVLLPDSGSNCGGRKRFGRL